MDRKCLALLTLFLAATASAETAYVTDNLRLGLHQAADTSDRSFRTLDSGQEVDILDRDRNYAHVLLPDGVEGYVKAAYLVVDKPAKLIVAETAARVLQLEEELADTKNAFAVPGATIASLEQELEQNRAELDAATSNMTEMTEEIAKYKFRHDQFKYSLPLSWVGAAMATCLLFGFLGGLYWIDRKSRKRHGGIRIY